jgi:hypothetical protein
MKRWYIWLLSNNSAPCSLLRKAAVFKNVYYNKRQYNSRWKFNGKGFNLLRKPIYIIVVLSLVQHADLSFPAKQLRFTMDG